MEIRHNNTISFQRLPMKELNGLKVPKKFACVNSKNDSLVVDVLERNHLNNSMGLDLRNSDNKRIASEGFDIFANGLKSLFLSTESGYEKQGNGAVMHLTKIIMMLENKLNRIFLFSGNDAYKFHKGMLFDANITDKSAAIEQLKKTFLFMRPEYEGLYQEAYKLANNDVLSDKAFLTESNQLLDKFAIAARKDKTNAPVPEIVMDMQLTKEKVLDNKEFFNNLFEIHEIDFQV